MRSLVLKNGQIIADNTPEELARSTSKVRIHLAISKELTVALSFIKNQQLLQFFLSVAIIQKIKANKTSLFLQKKEFHVS